MRQLLVTALLVFSGALLLRAGAEQLALGIPCLVRAASGLAHGDGPLACVAWVGSDGRPAVHACAGWRDGRPWLGIDTWRSGG